MKKISTLFLLCLLPLTLTLIAGCTPGELSSRGENATTAQQTAEVYSTQYPSTPAGEATGRPSPEASHTPRPTYTPTPTEEICTETKGHIELREIVIPETSDTLPLRVYVPACYRKNMEGGYPVLYFLHGQSFNDDQWDRLGADVIAEQLIADGEATPFLIVMPYERNFMEDPKTSTYGQLIIDSLLPWVEKEYNTCNLRECRAIGGLSRGAGWAMHLGLTHADLFGSIGAHSPAIFAEDFYNSPLWFKEIPDDSFPRIYMDDGSQDYMLESAKRFEAWLTKYHVSHEWIINQGAHDEEYWSAHVEDYLYWYTFAWKNLPKNKITITPSCTIETPTVSATE